MSDRPMRFPGLLCGLLLLAAGSLSAQTTPPGPGPVRDVAFPAFSQITLPNGAELIVVENREQPFIAVNLVLPGGAVGDLVGREGTAEFVANLLTAGTSNRSGDEIAAQLDRLGATLQGSVGLDWTTIGLEVLSPSLNEGLLLMADAVRNPSFAINELGRLRNQMLQGLAVAESDPSSIAARQFVRAVFAGHPYGRLATQASVRTISRDEVVAYHERYFRPGGAVFVVAGDINASEAEAALTRVFGDWTGAVPTGSPPSVQTVSAPTERQIYIVDLPTAAQVAMVVGGAFPSLGDSEDAWTALTVATDVLGGPLRGRLYRTLRQEKGWTYSVAADAGRRVGPGLMRIDAMVRPEVADSAVIEVLAELSRVTTTPLPEDELAQAKDYLSGSYPLELETPQQVAAQLLRYELLGLDVRLPESFRSRVNAVDTQAALQAFQSAIDPETAVVVIVGDATALAGPLSELGTVQILNADGTPVDPDAFTFRDDLTFDATVLTPGRWEYDVVAGQRKVGEMIRTITRFDGPTGSEITLVSAMDLLGVGHANQTVSFSGDFRPLSAIIDRDLNNQVERAAFDLNGDMLIGSTLGVDGVERVVSRQVPEGAVIGEMQEVAIWLADLEAVSAFSVPVMSSEGAGLRTMRARVVGEGSIIVPAGNFDVWEVEYRLDGPPQTVYLTQSAPHLLVQLGGQDAPLRIVLRSSGGL